MKVKVQLKNEDKTIDWPDGVLIPSVGDDIVDSDASITVRKRRFAITEGLVTINIESDPTSYPE
jgi:hypothetical protein